MLKKILFAASFLILATALPSYSYAQLFGGGTNLQQFCEQSTFRQTIVYIDAASIETGDTAWAKQLASKLEGNLLPHESVSIVQLNTDTGDSEEVWSGCWPAQAEGSGGFFGKDPARVFKEAKSMFMQLLGRAVSKVYSEGIALGSIENRQIIRALASDESRLDPARGLIRVIIYSDMVEDSDLINRSELSSSGGEAAKKIAYSADNAVVHVFGLKGRESSDMKAFWDEFFHTSTGHLASFGSDLAIPGSPPSKSAIFDIEADRPERTFVGHLHILYDDQNGALQDSYIAFSGPGRAAIAGRFTCNVNDVCVLEAETERGVLTNAAGEEIDLEGKISSLKGTIGHSNARDREGNSLIVPLRAVERGN